MRLQELAGPRTKSRFTFSATLPLLTTGLALTPASQSAQNGGTQPAQNIQTADSKQGVNVGRVYLTGTNPVIKLLDKPGEVVARELAHAACILKYTARVLSLRARGGGLPCGRQPRSGGIVQLWLSA
jgi:hypothetical protein